MSFLSSVTSAAVGGIWKVAAIGLAAALVTSSVFLGYEWHSAAADKATAVLERSSAEHARDKAIGEKGELTAHIGNQNAALKILTDRTLIAESQYATAMDLFGPLKGKIDALAKGLAAQAPSTTCQQALAKQRQAIDGLRAVAK
jgi:hypothetical protein